MMSAEPYDYVVVGGGLQGCLLMHALAHYRPDARVLLIERSSALCGNHTWSFHETDVPPEAWDWLRPLVDFRWPAYRVAFPGMARRVELGYATISSDGLRAATAALADGESLDRGSRGFRFDEACEIASPTQVVLSDQTVVESRVVVDCRGRAGLPARPAGAGFQTFFGCEYQLHEAWPAAEPTVMDVREDQADGFEFLYELPFGPHRVLLEYTRFSEAATCDEERAQSLISTRLAEAGVSSPQLVRREQGCLPMPYAKPELQGNRAIAGGYAGGWYHAATGYSMPLAIRFAELVAGSQPHNLAAAVAAAASQDATRRGFSRFLNRLLFCLVKPQDRWKIFRRFYSVLREDRIARFYSHRFTVADAARIVIGKPPTGLAPLRFAQSFVPLAKPVLP